MELMGTGSPFNRPDIWAKEINMKTQHTPDNQCKSFRYGGKDCTCNQPTPGPWKVKELHPNYGGHVLVRDTGHGLARIDDKNGSFSEVDANFIVDSCNGYEKLKKLLIEAGMIRSTDPIRYIELTDEAIALSGGK